MKWLRKRTDFFFFNVAGCYHNKTKYKDRISTGYKVKKPMNSNPHYDTTLFIHNSFQQSIS